MIREVGASNKSSSLIDRHVSFLFPAFIKGGHELHSLFLIKYTHNAPDLLIPDSKKMHFKVLCHIPSLPKCLKERKARKTPNKDMCV